MEVGSLRFTGKSTRVDPWTKHDAEKNKIENGILACFKRSWMEFAKTTSLHGVNKIVDESQPLIFRIGWALLVLCLLTTAVMLVVSATVEMFEDPPRITEITTIDRDGLVDNSNNLIPEIHICETSFFNKTILKEYGVDNELASYILLSFSPLIMNDEFVTKHEVQRHLAARLDNVLKNITFKELLHKGKLGCDFIIASCIINGHILSGEQCCKEYFGDRTELSVAGSCVSTYFSERTINQNRLSPFYGFVVTVRSNPDTTAFEFDGNIVSPIVAARKGLIYTAANNITHPLVWLQTYGQCAATGQWITVAIAKTQYDNRRLKGYNKKGCVEQQDAGDLRKQLTPFYPTYGYMNCKQAMLQNQLEGMKKCSSAVVPPNKNDTRICRPEDVIQMENYLRNTSLDFVTELMQKCSMDCVYDGFTLTPSFGQVSHSSGTRFIDPQNRSSTTTLHFYYPTFTYTLINSYYPSLSNRIGELGGNLGLFVGASLVTVFEVLFMLWNFYKRLTAKDEATLKPASKS